MIFIIPVITATITFRQKHGKFSWNDGGKAILFLLRKDQSNDSVRGERIVLITNV